MSRRRRQQPHMGSAKWWRLVMKEWSGQIASGVPRHVRLHGGRKRHRSTGYYAARPAWDRARQAYEEQPR